MNAAPKPVRIRSSALTKSARGQECTLRTWLCGTMGDDTVVFCHVRRPGNAGVGTKPPDFWGYYGCTACHSLQENHHIEALDVLDAICETQTRMARDGLLQIKGWKP
jgi:hypothetical protein